MALSIIIIIIIIIIGYDVARICIRDLASKTSTVGEFIVSFLQLLTCLGSVVMLVPKELSGVQPRPKTFLVIILVSGIAVIFCMQL